MHTLRGLVPLLLCPSAGEALSRALQVQPAAGARAALAPGMQVVLAALWMPPFAPCFAPRVAPLLKLFP